MAKIREHPSPAGKLQVCNAGGVRSSLRTEEAPLALQPARQFTRLREIDHLGRGDRGQLSHRFEGGRGRFSIEIEDAHGLAAGGVAGAAYGHLCDVYIVLPEDRADAANDARDVLVRE